MIGPREKVPKMTSMDSTAFSMDYPKGWDQRCEVERSGYPVCGMANHKWYNEVDTFAGTDIDPTAVIVLARYSAGLHFSLEHRAERSPLARRQCGEHVGAIGGKPAEGQIVFGAEQNAAMLEGEVSSGIVSRVVHQNQVREPFRVVQ